MEQVIICACGKECKVNTNTIHTCPVHKKKIWCGDIESGWQEWYEGEIKIAPAVLKGNNKPVPTIKHWQLGEPIVCKCGFKCLVNKGSIHRCSVAKDVVFHPNGPYWALTRHGVGHPLIYIWTDDYAATAAQEPEKYPLSWDFSWVKA